MSPEDQDRMWGAITAQNHLLEHLWAFTISAFGEDSAERAEAVRRVSERVLAEFDLPTRDTPSEGKFVASQFALAELEDFWRRVGERVR